jgi:hypothetical protein
MTKRRALWLGAAIVVLAAVALVYPASPVYFPKLVSWKGYQDRHYTSHWIDALNDPDVKVRRKAIVNLGMIGADAVDAVPALITILEKDPSRALRHQAAKALSKMAPASRAAVPALGKALTDVEPFVRMNAVIGLFRMKADARPAIPQLIAALQDESNQTNVDAYTFTIQEMAALALGRASAGEAAEIAALRTALERSRTDSMRMATARALGEVGPAAQSAVPQIRALLKDNNAEVREVAAEALRKIDPKAAEQENQAKANTPADEVAALPDQERKYLWDIEHHGNLLVKHGFGRLADALKRADAAALSRLLADGFAGGDLQQPKHIRAAKDFAEVERHEESGRPPAALTRDAFVGRLLALRRLFAGTPQVKLKLMGLHPQRRHDIAGTWEGSARLRIYGEHAAGAPAEVVVMLRYETARPSAQTLARPGWLRAATILQAQTARAPRYLFAEVAQQRGLQTASLHDNWTSPTLHTTPGGVYVCDFDRDGILDLLVTDVTGNTLYRGRPDGTFEDVTDRFGLPRNPLDNTVAAWVDIDGDGWDDLLLGGRVYRNEMGQRFTDYTARCSLRLPKDLTGIVVADYDRDGKLDLYVTRAGRPRGQSWITGESGDSAGNYLFRNKGSWQFEDVTRASGTQAGHRSSFTAAWLDANNDGWPDLHVINEFGDGVLLINNGNGTFSPHALAGRPADFGSMGLAVGDVDNDGNIDIYCADMYSKAGSRIIGNLAPDAFPAPVMTKMRRFVAGSQLHLNKGGLKFEQAGEKMQVAAIGWAYGACLADLDNDGWLDLYATAGFVSNSRDTPDG